MKKIVLGVVGVLVLLVGGFLLWATLIGNKRSPQETVSSKALGATVTYCRPFKKDRVIFGEEKDGALVPNGQYWRLGANAATTISFEKDVTFGDKAVKAGTYSMYAIPGASAWKVVLNSESDRWGAREADHAKDVVSTEVPVEKAGHVAEQFTISFEDKLVFAWDTTKVQVPIVAAQ
jgi:hypothetical protein